MPDASVPVASARLFSQTPHDERGNFHYQGDLYRVAEPLNDLARRIADHLSGHFPEAQFAVRAEKYSLGRKIIVELLDSSLDLTGRDAQRQFTVEVRDQIERFGFTRSNFYLGLA